MPQEMSSTVPILNTSILIREDETNRHNDQKDAQNDLIFEAVDDEDSFNEKTSPSTDKEIHLRSSVERTKKRERTHSSISTVDDEWENILPITEGDGSLTSINHLQSINKKNSIEKIIGMSNFRAKHHLHRHSKNNTLVRWKDAMKKAAHLKDPW